MSVYTDNYKLRYDIPSVTQQTEVAVVHAAMDILNAAATPETENEREWATWANKNSKEAAIPFGWPVGMNSSIQASIASDPTGGSVLDSDIQFVVNSNLDSTIADFILNPPPGVRL
jgi:hypothetical protein